MKVKVNLIQDSILVMSPVNSESIPSIVIHDKALSFAGKVEIPEDVVELEFDSIKAIKYLKLACEEAINKHALWINMSEGMRKDKGTDGK